LTAEERAEQESMARQKAEAIAKQQSLLANQERKQKEQERQQKEKLANYLRSMGIDPDAI
jgi:hypothetical protein